MTNGQTEQTNAWYCEKCLKTIRRLEDVFTITGAGRRISLKIYCEPCCDQILDDAAKAAPLAVWTELAANAERSLTAVAHA